MLAIKKIIIEVRFYLKTLVAILTHKHIVFIGVLCLFLVSVSSQIKPKQLRQEVLKSQAPIIAPTKAKSGKTSQKSKTIAEPKPLAPTVNPLANAGVTLVYLENSESLSFDKVLNPDVQVLKGNVRFRHDNAIMYCDSAYFFETQNSFNAFGHVKIVQGDTLFVYGDLLYYDGNTKLGRLRHNVKLINRKTTLTTDSLNYDRAANIAYYYTGGKIVDPLNKLTSVWGQYTTSSNEALFKTKVVLTNKNFTLKSDTLKYNTKSSIANIVGQTHIRYNNETDIYSRNGWYNTNTEKMMLLCRSIIKHKDGKTMTGDSLFYDKKMHYGEGFTNVELIDSIQKSTLKGDYVNYNEKSEVGLAIDSAQVIDWSSKDSLFLHADTLYRSKDSIYNAIRANYHVRFFRNDVQGLCDSLTYSTRDSIMNMSGLPVIWSDVHQLSGNDIKAFVKDNKVKKLEIQGAAIAVEKVDSINYNQLSGKEIIALVDSGQVRKVSVNGNAETIYFPRDEKDSSLIGVNKTQSSFVVMYLKNKKVERLVMTSASTGTLYPLLQLPISDLYLKNYFWLDNERPKKKEDIFALFPNSKRSKKLEVIEKPSNSILKTLFAKPTTTTTKKKVKKKR